MPPRLAARAQMLLQLVSEREERGFSDWFVDAALHLLRHRSC